MLLIQYIPHLIKLSIYMNLRLLFTLKMLYYFQLKYRKITMKKITTLILLSFLASISFSNATEFNENSLYSDKVESAYNQIDLPLLPGSWKIYDLEKSGSVASGNFYVYATLVPEVLQPGDNSLNFDGITFAVLGSKSEETDYRRSFYACDAGWITDSKVTTSNINTRGSGNFEETCSVINEIQPFYTFFYTDCSEICVEVNFALKASDYNINANNFDSVSSEIFMAIRNTVLNSADGQVAKVIDKYKG